MSLQYPMFYRQFGLRRVAQLMNPALPILDRLELPRDSLYHYVGDGLLDDGPRSDEFLFRNITRPIFMYHVTEIGDFKGNPRRLTIPVDPLIRSYHVKNRRYRKLMDLKQIPKDPMGLTVINYSYIPRLYRYMRSIYSDYYRWHNQQMAIWKTVNEIAVNTNKNQFIILKLPTRLPSISELKLASKGVNQRVVKTFNSSESLILLEFWKWLGDDRASSVFAQIGKENYNKMNFIFMESGRFLVFNLGVLDSWRSASKQELREDPNANTKGFDSIQIQKRFLRLLISLFDTRIKEVPENLQLDDSEVEDKQQTEVKQNTDVNTPTQKKESITPPKQEEVLTVQEDKERRESYHNGIDSASDIEEDFYEDDFIDKELEELERIAKLTMVDIQPSETEDDDEGDDDYYQEEESEVKELETELLDSMGGDSNVLEKALMKVADRYAENGLISAAEYKRYQDLSESYKNIVAPDGKSTLDTFIDIKPEELKVPETLNIPDTNTVYDKTMLKSSLLNFDEYYIKNILHRDIASMVMNIQKAGIAVTDYQVERVDSILGSYDDYSVKINPIEGASSTIRFKLPVINEDGTYKSNNSIYSIRKQKGD